MSCGDDDDNSEVNDPNSIIGKWTRTYDNGKGWVSYEFKKNGKCIYKGSEDGFTYTWKTEGVFLTLSQDLDENFIYEINNGTMKLWLVFTSDFQSVDVEKIKKEKSYDLYTKEMDKE